MDDAECIISILLNYLTVPKTPVLNAGDLSDLDISCECLRLLRNCCAGSRDNQLLINKSSEFVQALPELLTSCLKYSELSESQNQHESNQGKDRILHFKLKFVSFSCFNVYCLNSNLSRDLSKLYALIC